MAQLIQCHFSSVQNFVNFFSCKVLQIRKQKKRKFSADSNVHDESKTGEIGANQTSQYQ